jgi:hypothetical protein
MSEKVRALLSSKLHSTLLLSAVARCSEVAVAVTEGCQPTLLLESEQIDSHTSKLALAQL